MAAIDNLETAVQELSVKVDAVLAKPGPDPNLETRIQAQADAVTAQNARLDTFINA